MRTVKKRWFLKIAPRELLDQAPEDELTKEEFIVYERRAGFRKDIGPEPVTNGFEKVDLRNQVVQIREVVEDVVED